MTLAEWKALEPELRKWVIDDGRTYRSIGSQLGVTRSAVAGACTRLGIRSGRGTGGIMRKKKYPDPQPLALPEVDTCRWMDGDLKARTHKWCSKPALPLKPYCQEHMDRAYVKGTAMPFKKLLARLL